MSAEDQPKTIAEAVERCERLVCEEDYAPEAVATALRLIAERLERWVENGI